QKDVGRLARPPVSEAGRARQGGCWPVRPIEVACPGSRVSLIASGIRPQSAHFLRRPHEGATPMQFDVLIVGASFAGLAAARTAASRGLSVAVIEAKRDAGARVHTSGILVREAIDEIDLPHHLTRRVPGV